MRVGVEKNGVFTVQKDVSGCVERELKIFRKFGF